MGSMSNYMEDKLLNHVFRNTAYSYLAPYLAFFTSDAGLEAGTISSEVANSNAYARTAIPFTTVAAARTIGNSSLVTFPTATGSWGTVTHWAIMDSSTHGAGNVLFHGAFTASKAVFMDDVAKIAIGDIDCTISTGGLGTATANDWLDKALNNVAFVPTATIYIALYTATPGDADSGTEVTGGAYVRQTIVFGAPASQIIANTGAIAYPVATANYGTVDAYGIRTALSGGTLLGYAAMDVSKAVNIDDTAKLASGAVDINAAAA